MSVWDKYSKEQRDAYVNYLQMYGALSALFNQKSSMTGAPYLDSKFQETIYARCFNSKDVDIGNTPHDIRSTFDNERIGIGIKTWLNSRPSFQKVMQLKSLRSEIDPIIDSHDAEALAYKLSAIKNQRLLTDYKRLGLVRDNNVYHYVTRDRGCMNIFETSYPLVDLDNLRPLKMTNSSLLYSDGYKRYKFTYSDHEIWMYFGENTSDTVLLSKFPVNILDDPFDFLRFAFNDYIKSNLSYVRNNKYDDEIFLPLYSYRYKKVLPSSGLNNWNSLPKSGTTVRPEGEAYIPIPKILWRYKPYWVDPKVNMGDYKLYHRKTGLSSVKIKLHMPDGSVFDAIFTQSNFKGLQTNPQSVLGKWLLSALGINKPVRERYDLPSDNVVTMHLLQQVGYDSVRLWHKDPNKPRDIWIDFAEYGSFERFIYLLSKEYS